MNIIEDEHRLVLVVDDELLVRLFAVSLLEDQGFRTIEACDAAEAFAQIEHHSEVAVLLTDINMPGELDGLTLAFEVRERWPGMVMIVTSGRVRPSANELPDYEDRSGLIIRSTNRSLVNYRSPAGTFRPDRRSEL